MTDHRWYAIQTTAGHGEQVRSLIDRRIKDDRARTTRSRSDSLVPTQEVVEIKNGKKVTVERKIYPGYVLVNHGLESGDDPRHQRHSGLIKFVGTGRLPAAPPGGGEPPPGDRGSRQGKRAAGADSVPGGAGRGDHRRPFSDFSGTVEEVIRDKGKVRVAVSLFGRPTSVELDYLQLKAH